MTQPDYRIQVSGWSLLGAVLVLLFVVVLLPITVVVMVIFGLIVAIEAVAHWFKHRSLR